MYADNFYNLIGATGLGWALVALAYAALNYGYDVVMCWLTGGLPNVELADWRRLKIKSIPKKTRVFLKVQLQQFQTGGRQRLAEFRSDSLSWLWPITILAIPTFIYGLTRSLIINTASDLNSAGLPVADYRLPLLVSVGDNLQYIILIISLVNALFTFIRYRQRSASTWFSKSPFFHLTRVVFFDSVLSYMVINILLLWLDFSIALFRMLSDEALQYSLLYPDLMYGLETAHTAVIAVSFLLLLISLLPTIMLIRESKESYSRIYYGLLYSGLATIFILVSVLVYQFNHRLSTIQETALTEIVETSDLGISLLASGADLSAPTLGLHFYSLVSSLPSSFPVPAWIGYLFSARLILIVYEVYLLTSTDRELLSIGAVFRRILEVSS